MEEKVLIDWLTEPFWGSFFESNIWKKLWKMYFFWKSAVISAFFGKTIKIVKSYYKSAFWVAQNSKKLGHTSLKRRFLSCFDVFENKRRSILLNTTPCDKNTVVFFYNLKFFIFQNKRRSILLKPAFLLWQKHDNFSSNLKFFIFQSKRRSILLKPALLFPPEIFPCKCGSQLSFLISPNFENTFHPPIL